jgi:hypothetical protein
VVKKFLRTPTASPRQVLSLRLSRTASVAADRPSASKLASCHVRNSSSARCVGSVQDLYALRSVRIPVPASYPSPQSTLLGVFQKLKRAARAKKSLRISERFASPRVPGAIAAKLALSRIPRVVLN